MDALAPQVRSHARAGPYFENRTSVVITGLVELTTYAFEVYVGNTRDVDQSTRACPAPGFDLYPLHITAQTRVYRMWRPEVRASGARRGRWA